MMVKKIKGTGKAEEKVPLHVDIALPDGRRVLLPAPAFGLAVRFGTIKAQMSDDERQAFDVVAMHTEYAAMEKMLDEATVLTRIGKLEKPDG